MDVSAAPTGMNIQNTYDTRLPEARDLLEAGPGSIAVIDGASLGILFVTRQFQAMLGYSDAELKNSSFSFRNILRESDVQRFLLQLELVKANPGQHERFSAYTLTRQNGEKRAFYLFAAAVGQEGLFQLYIMPDITPSGYPFHSADSRDLFLKQIEVEKFGSFEWVIATGSIFWTDGLYDIYDLPRGTKIERDSLAKYRFPEDEEKILAAVQKALSGEDSIELEMRIITDKGNIKVLHTLGCVIKDDTGKPIRFTGSVKDITSQRKIEHDLKKKVEELNQSNKELEEFAYVASHDLQEPLRKISTFSERLADKYAEVLSGDGAMYLERMMASAENMRMLIHNLLEFSRVTRQNEPFSSVGLGFVLRQVKADLELVIEETGTVIKSGELPEVKGSLSQLVQLFSNIIGNAIKFRGEEKPMISIELASASRAELLNLELPLGKKYHRISICDNGIGFEPEYAEKIFQVFQRLHGKAEYPGSGVGLAICRRIVENHGGRIYAQSLEKGACFVILLPAE